MEIEVREYIKKMFFIESRPEWTAFYEGVILFDAQTNTWICGDSIGWVELKQWI